MIFVLTFSIRIGLGSYAVYGGSVATVTVRENLWFRFLRSLEQRTRKISPTRRHDEKGVKSEVATNDSRAFRREASCLCTECP